MGIEQIIPGESEYEKLLKEIRELQARIVELTAIRDDLLYHICPSLRACGKALSAGETEDIGDPSGTTEPAGDCLCEGCGRKGRRRVPPV